MEHRPPAASPAFLSPALRLARNSRCSIRNCSVNPLDGLQKVRADAAFVLELVAAVMGPDAGSGTFMLVIGAFVGILKSAPAADVIDEDCLEVGLAGLDLGHRVLQCLAAIEPQPGTP